VKLNRLARATVVSAQALYSALWSLVWRLLLSSLSSCSVVTRSDSPTQFSGFSHFIQGLGVLFPHHFTRVENHANRIRHHYATILAAG